jgi:CDP-diacylglycerol--glycerol-3-phosphate 3-phosphatidyltransferase
MKKPSRTKIWNLPNRLTFLRLACIPLVFFFLNFPGKLWSLLAALLFGIASVTDILDGFLARKYGAVTTFGKFLDPLADKLLVSVTMIMLIPLGRIPPWMVIVIISREMAVTALRGMAVNEGVVIQADRLGKFKTISQSIALGALCLHYPYLGIDFHYVGMIVLWAALVLTLWSGWNYFAQFKHVFFPRGT